jgi:hypothetical protein
MTFQGLMSPEVSPTLTVTYRVMQHCLGDILRAGWPRDRGSFPCRDKKCVQTSCEAHPASYSTANGNVLPGGQVDHSHPSGADVNSDVAVPPHPLYLHGKHRDRLTVTCTDHPRTGHEDPEGE